MRVLFIGDVVGGPGRRGLERAMPGLRERHRPDLVVINGENAAGGMGITKKTAEQLFRAGADAITTGNHVYRHRDVYDYLDSAERIVRPANYPHGNPGRGHIVFDQGGSRVAIINLSGTVSLQAARSPFHEADSILDRLGTEVDLILVDFHAEVTSEKVALGWHLDGRVTAVLGTHTHVPTADGRVLPGGTAFITDVGMTGSRAGVLGVRREIVLEQFLTQMPVRYETADEDVWVMGALVESTPEGLATSITQVLEPVPET